MPRLIAMFAAAFLWPAIAAAGAEPAALEALKAGEMTKLVILAEPKPVPDGSFGDLDGAERRIDDFRGKVVVLNFWATWCAPCRAEMASLDALQAALGGDGIAVVTLATGRNSPQAIRRFFEEEGITGLPQYTDPDMGLARSMAIFGLPVTVILDRDGLEVARLTGGADWNSESARAILTAIAGG